jgi:transposase-like protein
LYANIREQGGRTGFGEAIKAIFPKSEIRTGIVHQVRNLTRFNNYKDRMPFCAGSRVISTEPNEAFGLAALDRFEEAWGGK